VTFSQPFSLTDIDGIQPAGTYRVQTVDVSLDNSSSHAYRRISTTIELPRSAPPAREGRQDIDPLELEAAPDEDRAGNLFHAVMNYWLDAAIGEVAERNGARLRVHFANRAKCLKKEDPLYRPSVDRSKSSELTHAQRRPSITSRTCRRVAGRWRGDLPPQ
jgi:hypothetical protein